MIALNHVNIGMIGLNWNTEALTPSGCFPRSDSATRQLATRGSSRVPCDGALALIDLDPAPPHEPEEYERWDGMA